MRIVLFLHGTAIMHTAAVGGVPRSERVSQSMQRVGNRVRVSRAVDGMRGMFARLPRYDPSAAGTTRHRQDG